MPVMRSAVNGLAIGILSGTRAVMNYYKNGENNQYVWGSKPTVPVQDAPLVVESALPDVKDAIDPPQQPELAKKGRKGRVKKMASTGGISVVEDDPDASESESNIAEIQSVLAEKGIA